MTAQPLLTSGELDAAIYAVEAPYASDTDWPPLPYNRRVDIPAVVKRSTAGPNGVLLVVNHDAAIQVDNAEALVDALQTAFPMPATDAVYRSYADMGMTADTDHAAPAPCDREPLGLLCDQPQPYIKCLRVHPRDLAIGDVVEVISYNSVSGTAMRQYRITAIETQPKFILLLTVEWLHSGKTDYQRIDLGALILPKVVGGAKVDAAMGNMKLVEWAGWGEGDYIWKGNRR